MAEGGAAPSHNDNGLGDDYNGSVGSAGYSQNDRRTQDPNAATRNRHVVALPVPVQRYDKVENAASETGSQGHEPHMDRDQRIEMQMARNAEDMNNMVELDVEQVQRMISDLKKERGAMESQRDKCQQALQDIDDKVKKMLNVVNATLDLHKESCKHQTRNVTQLYALCGELQEMTYSRNEDTDVLKQKTQILENKQHTQGIKQQSQETEINKLVKQLKRLENRLTDFEKSVDTQLQQSVKSNELRAIQTNFEDLKGDINRIARNMQRPEPAVTAQAATPPVTISINSPINNYVSPCTRSERATARSGTEQRQNVGERIDASATRRKWTQPDHTQTPPGPTSVYEPDVSLPQGIQYGDPPTYSSLNPRFKNDETEVDMPTAIHLDSGTMTMPFKLYNPDLK